MSSPIDALAVLGYHRDEAGEWRYGVFGEPVDYTRRSDALDSLAAMGEENAKLWKLLRMSGPPKEA